MVLQFQKITKNDKHTYFKEEGLYFDLYQLNTLKAKINKNQRECYFQFSNEVYNDAKERLTKKELMKLLLLKEKQIANY